MAQQASIRAQQESLRAQQESLRAQNEVRQRELAQQQVAEMAALLQRYREQFGDLSE